MKFSIESTLDVKTFIENSGIINWTFTGSASAEGFAAWIWINRSEINTENYDTELTEYLISVGENPTDYGLVKSNSAPTPNPSPEVQGADSAAVAVNDSGATFSEPDEEIPSFFLAFVNEDGIDERVLNSSHADKSKVKTLLYDRVANKESFPGEYVAFGTVNDWNTIKISAFNSGIITLKGENDYTIHISGERGHFEKDGEAIGGLWFEDRTLIDQDGTFSLPKSVAKALRDAGYEVSEDFI